MQLHTYLHSLTPERRTAFVARLGVHPFYVSQIANSLLAIGERAPKPSERKPSPELAVLIEKETRGAVKRFECRRDLWRYDASRVVPAPLPQSNGSKKKKSTAKKTRA